MDEARTLHDPTDASPARPRRIIVAYTRCRMKRSKCVHRGQPPCVSCSSADVQDGCIFPARGTSFKDRAPRGLRKRKDKFSITSNPGQSKSKLNVNDAVTGLLTLARPEADDAGDSLVIFEPGHLPPWIEVMEGIRFSIVQLSKEPSSVSSFLILAMLSISSRFTPSLISRYGSRRKAVDAFLSKAHSLIMDEMRVPTLERVQAFYLLGVADWGQGNGCRAWMLQGIAVRMAEMIRLGREGLESQIPPTVDLEVRRRTWWFLTLNNNQLSVGWTTPLYLDPMINSTPLPSQEEDFASGKMSPVMYYSEASLALKSDARFSMLGAMVTLYILWGRVAHSLCGQDSAQVHERSLPPWDSASLFSIMQHSLSRWFSLLDEEHHWSMPNLLSCKESSLDLALYTISCNFNIIHIAIRRQHLPIMIKALHPGATDDVDACSVSNTSPPDGRKYWEKMAHAMVAHAFELLQIQDLMKSFRDPIDGCTPLIVFGMYLSGSILNYVRLCPWLCPSLASRAATAVASILGNILKTIDIWPMAEHWFFSLSSQYSITPPDSTSGERESSLANHDIDLDTRFGLWRQFTHEKRDFGSRDKTKEPYTNASTLALVDISGAIQDLQQKDLNVVSTCEQLSVSSSLSTDNTQYTPSVVHLPLELSDQTHHAVDAGPESLVNSFDPDHQSLPVAELDLNRFEVELSAYLWGNPTLDFTTHGGASLESGSLRGDHE